MNKYLGGCLFSIFLSFSLTMQHAHATEVPLIPAVYLGHHNQAAIVLDTRSTTPTGLAVGTEPSHIVDACFDGKAGIYFVAAPEPWRLYHWAEGDANVTLEAVEDDLSTDVVALMRQLQQLDLPNPEKTPRFCVRDGGLCDTNTMRAIPTPPFANIDQLIEMPNDMLAVFSYTEGVSIVNTSLPLGRTLCIDPGLRASDAMMRGFAMANPDIHVKQVVALETTRDEDPMDGPATLLPDYLKQTPSLADVFFVPIEEASSAARANCLLKLSASEALLEAMQGYYPCVQDVIEDAHGVFAIPGLMEPQVWATSEECTTKLGREIIPRTLNGLVSLIRGINGIWLDSVPEMPEQVLGRWMAEQYVIQYAQVNRALDFDTPLFRNLLEQLQKDNAQQEQGDADTHKLFYVERARAHDLPMDSVPFLPPAFEKNTESSTFAELYVWCVDAQTPNVQEALCFIEFAVRYLDPVYACYLSPSQYEPISSPRVAAQLAIAEAGYRQALLSNLEKAKEVRQLLSQSLKALHEIPPLLSEPVFDFYQSQIVPRLRFLLGGLYLSMEKEYGSSENLFIAIDSVKSGDMTVNEAIQQLNQEAAHEYALWH